MTFPWVMLAVALALPHGETVPTATFLDRGGGPAKRTASAEVTWRDDSLCIRVKRRLAAGERPLACGTADRPETMFGGKGESLEIFLAPHTDDPGTLYQFAVNPSNVCYQAKGADYAWRPAKPIVTKPYFTDGEWGVDFTVPFGAFGERPVGKGTRWRANFASGAANWSAISFYHNPFAYGELAFGERFARVDPVPRKAEPKDGRLFELDRYYFPVGTARAEILRPLANVTSRIRRLDGRDVAEDLAVGEYAVWASDGVRTAESQFEIVDAADEPPPASPYYVISGSVDIGSRLELCGVLSGGYDSKLKKIVYDSSLPDFGGVKNLANRRASPLTFNRFAYEAQIPVATRCGKDGPVVDEPSASDFYIRQYRALKPKFPNHIFSLHIDYLSDIANFAKACDVLEATFPGCSYSADPLVGIRGAFDYMRYYVGDKPIVFWLGGALPNRGANRTADEMNAAIRYSILRGAVGNIFHLGHGGIPESRTRLWDFLRGVERRVNAWYPRWVGGARADLGIVAEDGVAVEARKVVGGYVLLAVNLSPSARSLSFFDPEAHARRTVLLPGFGSALLETPYKNL